MVIICKIFILCSHAVLLMQKGYGVSADDELPNLIDLVLIEIGEWNSSYGITIAPNKIKLAI